MLTIQPNFTNNYSVKPAFKGWDKDTIAEERNFYERQRDELDDLISDDYVPDKIKKPFKFFRMAANAAISGLAVFGSAIAVASFFKKAAAKFVNNNATQKAGEKVVKPLGNKIASGIKYVANKITAGLEILKNTNIGKKCAETFAKFEKTEIGAKVVKIAKKVGKKIKDIAKKMVSPIKKMNYDNATKATATVLGVGSGAAGGYEEYMKASPIETQEEEG